MDRGRYSDDDDGDHAGRRRRYGSREERGRERHVRDRPYDEYDQRRVDRIREDRDRLHREDNSDRRYDREERRGGGERRRSVGNSWRDERGSREREERERWRDNRHEGDGHQHRGGGGGGRVRAPSAGPPSIPQLYSIHRGEVESVKEYGAFVRLHQLNVTGMVHCSQLSRHRVEHANEVVDRGDVVWVKVLEVQQEDNDMHGDDSGARGKLRISLSVKYADQGENCEDRDLDRNNVQWEQEQLRRTKKDGAYTRDPIELEAILDVECRKCGKRGHLPFECFAGARGSGYDLIEEDDGGEVDAEAAQRAARERRKEEKRAKKAEDRARRKERKERRKERRKKKRKRHSGDHSHRDYSSSSSEDEQYSSRKRKREREDDAHHETKRQRVHR